jgi:hypothetical protein
MGKLTRQRSNIYHGLQRIARLIRIKADLTLGAFDRGRENVAVDHGGDGGAADFRRDVEGVVEERAAFVGVEVDA